MTLKPLFYFCLIYFYLVFSLILNSSNIFIFIIKSIILHFSHIHLISISIIIINLFGTFLPFIILTSFSIKSYIFITFLHETIFIRFIIIRINYIIFFYYCSSFTISLSSSKFSPALHHLYFLFQKNHFHFSFSLSFRSRSRSHSRSRSRSRSRSHHLNLNPGYHHYQFHNLISKIKINGITF